ncbi:MAG: hypothetical protein H7326_09255 [Bdellovibrionaceae bacterium]|nr:hypothetical protein [Pseudobdellovibrionaceae bacterium]
MKTMQQVFTILVVMLSISACSKWGQDPLAGEPLAQTDKRDGPTGEKPRPGTNSDNIRIDTVPTFGFQEETEGSFVIEARMLVPDYTTSIDIPNISEFAGATFDPNSGRFTWTPAVGTVVGLDSASKQLDIRVIAKKAGAEDQVRSESRMMVITRLNLAPTIESVSAPLSLREGKTGMITVVVIDRNASDGVESTWPTLVVSKPDYSLNIAGFLDDPEVTSIGNSKFKFQMELNLEDVEITDSLKVAGAVMRAYSSAGRSSAEREFQMDIMTSFSDLKTTWTETLHSTNGNLFEYTFAIYDPKGEINLDDPVFKDLPSTSTMNCRRANYQQTQWNCTFRWTPVADGGERAVVILAEVTVHNSYYSDKYTEVKKLTFELEAAPEKPAARIEGDLK